MSCCEESDGNLTVCRVDEREFQDSPHSQVLLLSLIFSLWIFSIVQFVRFDCSLEPIRNSGNHSFPENILSGSCRSRSVSLSTRCWHSMRWGYNQSIQGLEIIRCQKDEEDFKIQRPWMFSSLISLPQIHQHHRMFLDIFFYIFYIELQDINTDTNTMYLKEPPDPHLILFWAVPLQRGFLPPRIRLDLLTRSHPLVSAEWRHPREGMTSKISHERFSFKNW